MRPLRPPPPRTFNNIVTMQLPAEQSSFPLPSFSFSFSPPPFLAGAMFCSAGLWPVRPYPRNR
eukprot:5917584-Prymnesium_polylepis.2